MITLELTQDEYDTIWEALSEYSINMKQQALMTKGMNQRNYYNNESMLAEETLKKIDGKDIKEK